MKTLKLSLIATLIAMAAGFWAWEFGAAQRMWPAHPQVADFLVTLITAIVVQIAWPRMAHGEDKQG